MIFKVLQTVPKVLQMVFKVIQIGLKSAQKSSSFPHNPNVFNACSKMC